MNATIKLSLRMWLEKIQKAKEIVKQIDKVTPQVIIEARIVEVSDNFSQRIRYIMGDHRHKGRCAWWVCKF